MSALGIKDLAGLKDLKSYVKKLQQAKKKYESLKQVLATLEVDREFIKEQGSGRG